MKKVFISLLFLFLTSQPSFSLDLGQYGGLGDMVQTYSNIENSYNAQKKVTDEDYQQALKQVKARHNKKNSKKHLLKGKLFNEEDSGNYLGKTADKNILLVVPLALVGNDGKEIPIGHYEIVGERVKNKVYIDFYQSSFLVSHVLVKETNDDFNESNINFVKLLPYNEKKIKLIYGSLDFNAYAFINIKDGISD